MEEETLIAAIERMTLSTFVTKHTDYRKSMVPSTLFDLSDPKLILPQMSSLHIVSHFLDPSFDESIVPDLTFPLISRTQDKVYVRACFDVAGPDSEPFPVAERYTYQTGRLRTAFINWVNQTKDVHRVISDRSVNALRDALVVTDYAPLHHVLLQGGKFKEYRRFDLVLRTMLNNVVHDSASRHHFIHIPLGGRVFSKSVLQRGFVRLDTQQVNQVNDPSYFFLLHYLGMAYGAAHKAPVTPWPADVAYWESEGHEPLELHSTSLFARIPTTAARRIFLIVSHGGKASILNLADLQEFSQDRAFYDRLYRQVSTLCMLRDDVTEAQIDAMSDDEFTSHADDVASRDEQAVAPKEPEVAPEAPKVTKTISEVAKEIAQAQTTPSAKESVSQPPPVVSVTLPEKIDPVVAPAPLKVVSEKTTFSARVLNHAVALKETHAGDDTVQKRVDTLYQKHLNTKINERPIGELISHDTAPKVEQRSLSFMEHLLPEASMANSTVANFDQDYFKHLHDRDIAKTLSSLTNQGLFVTEVKQTKQRDRFNRIDRYGVRMVDAKGKAHSFSFSLPHVDSNGMMLVNGVKTRMIKQQVNLPIAKIDDWRVSISSNYNKALVTRTQLKAHRFDAYITAYIESLSDAGLIDTKSGGLAITPTPLPYEYTSIAQRYAEVDAGGYIFTFDYPTRFNVLTDVTERDHPWKIEKQYGVFCGTTPDGSRMFWDMNDAIHVVRKSGEHIASTVHFMEFMRALYGTKVPLKPVPAEYTQLQYLSQDFPVIFTLGFRFGLKKILKDIGLSYKTVDAKEKTELKLGDVRIDFADKAIIFSRYPLKKSLIASGLAWINTEDYSIEEFEDSDVYYRILDQKGISRHFLKGLGSFFDLFIDPITLEILKQYHYPTTVEGILLKATDLLSTYDYYPASMMRHHRMRGYERLSGTLYNEMARQYAAYQSITNPRKSFSINPEAVFLRIMGDSAVQQVETINPIHDIKTKNQLTYSGSGGRTSRAFVVRDRVFPKDAIGLMGETTPDSGKVGLTSYLTADPRFDNLRGTFKLPEEGVTYDTPQLLSVVGNLMPGVTQDDCCLL